MATSNTSSLNDSLPVHEAPCFLQDQNWILGFRIAPYVLIFSVAVIGNILVMTVVYRNKTMKKTINFFIANMAFSDLIFTIISIRRVVTILLHGYKWIVHGLLGLIFCRMVPFVMEITIIVSVLTIVAISLDRFLAVMFPLQTFIHKTLCLSSIFAMWIISIAVEIPTLQASHLDEFEGKPYCIVDLDITFGEGAGEIYFKFIFIVLYGIPLVVTAVLNFAIIVAMHKRSVLGNSVGEANERHREKTNRRVIRMVLVVVAAFLLCWSLYFILMVLRKNDVDVPCSVLYVRLLLAHFNAALTPVLYAVFSENYRQGFGEILSQLCCQVSVASRSDSTPTVVRATRRQSSTFGDNYNSRTSFQLHVRPAAPQYGSSAEVLE